MPGLTWDCKAKGVIYLYSPRPALNILLSKNTQFPARADQTEVNMNGTTEGEGIQALAGPSVKEKAGRGRLSGSTVPTQHLPSGPLLLLQGHHPLHSTELLPRGCISS